MDSKQTYAVSGGKLALAIALALIVGALCPIIMAVEVSVSVALPVVMINGVFMVFLYCYGGRIPAILFMVVQLAASAVLLGPGFMWMLMLAGTLPGIIAMRMIARKLPFFAQMRTSIVAYVVGLCLALFIAYSRYGGNMISRAMDALKDTFRKLPDSYFLAYVEMANRQSLANLIPGVNLITVQLYRSWMLSLLDMLEDAYALSLPGAMVSGAILSGVISTTWGNWLLARRGLATSESYVGLTRWFLPSNAASGLTLMWLASLLLTRTNYGAARTVYYAVYAIINIAFIIQGLAAIDRFFYRRGAAARGRHVVVTFAAILGLLFEPVGMVLFVIGAGSAFFGTHGLLRRRPNQGGGDDDNHADRDDPEQ